MYHRKRISRTNEVYQFHRATCKRSEHRGMPPSYLLPTMKDSGVALLCAMPLNELFFLLRCQSSWLNGLHGDHEFLYRSRLQEGGPETALLQKPIAFTKLSLKNKLVARVPVLRMGHTRGFNRQICRRQAAKTRSESGRRPSTRSFGKKPKSFRSTATFRRTTKFLEKDMKRISQSVKKN